MKCGGAKRFASRFAVLMRDSEISDDAFRALVAILKENPDVSELDGLMSEILETLKCKNISEYVRENTVALLLQVGPQGSQAAASLLSSSVPSARAAAASLLGQLGHVAQQWVSEIAQLLTDNEAC